MDVSGLSTDIVRDKKAALKPLLIVGTAGVTAACATAPLDKIADAAEREGLWLHADAAWSGAAVNGPELRHFV